MDKKLIPFNTVVEYDNGVMSGEGIIVGLAISSLPIIGDGYIIKDLSCNVPNDTYQYDSFVVYNIHLKVKNS
jgi:hypothetical protein